MNCENNLKRELKCKVRLKKIGRLYFDLNNKNDVKWERQPKIENNSKEKLQKKLPNL